jgi:hypothetical protein
MLMMDSLRTKSLTFPTFAEDDGQVSAGCVNNVATKTGENDHLALILAFLGREVERSATLLRDLAAGISDDFGAICASELPDDVQDRLIAATMALQNEDRLQQRLSDLRLTLSLLEQMLAEGGPAKKADINEIIIQKLKLEEMRNAFAVSMGLIDALPQRSQGTKEPSLGDIDLF